jgi:hypothetical protein
MADQGQDIDLDSVIDRLLEGKSVVDCPVGGRRGKFAWRRCWAVWVGRPDFAGVGGCRKEEELLDPPGRMQFSPSEMIGARD